MSAQEELKLYIKQITKGVVNLNNDHVNKIFNIVLKQPEVVTVQLFRYNGNNAKYELMRTFIMERELAEIKTHKLKPVKQWYYFYKFVISELEFEHYTVNQNLLP